MSKQNEMGGQTTSVLKQIAISAGVYALGKAAKWGYDSLFDAEMRRIVEDVKKTMRSVKRKPYVVVPASNRYEKVPIEDFDLKDFAEEHIAKEEQAFWKDEFASVIGNSIDAGMTISSYRGLLRCNVPLADLARVKDDGMMFRGFVTKNGKIKEQAQFFRAGFLQALPTLVRQHVSDIIAQSDYSKLDLHLDRIQFVLDQIVANDIAAKNGELQGIKSGLELLWRKGDYGKEDVICADSLLLQSEMLRNEFVNRVVGTDLLSVEIKAKTHKGCAMQMVENCRESNFCVNVGLASIAEVIWYVAIITRARMAYCNGDEQECLVYLDRLSMDNWSNLEYKVEQTNVCVLKYLEQQKEAALVGKGEISKEITDMKREFERCQVRVVETQKLLEGCSMTLYFRLDDTGELVRLRPTA